jgi:hypothetical protein
MPPRRTYDPAHLDVRIPATDWSDGQSVTLAPGIVVPAAFLLDLRHPEWPCPVRVDITVSESRGPHVSGIHALGPEATFDEAAHCLRGTVRLDQWLPEMTAFAAAARVEAALMPPVQELAKLGSAAAINEERNAVLRQAIRATSGTKSAAIPRRRRFITRDHLREVAGVYREAHGQGQPPTMAVAEHFHVAHRSATRWVAEARKVGELGPPMGTVAGEGPAPRKPRR